MLTNRGNDPLSTADFHKFRDPRRGTDPWVWPGFAVDAHFALCSPRLVRNCCKLALHLPYKTAGRGRALREPSKEADIGFDIGKCPRIHSKKIQRMLQEFGDGLLFVGNGANHERRL